MTTWLWGYYCPLYTVYDIAIQIYTKDWLISLGRERKSQRKIGNNYEFKEIKLQLKTHTHERQQAMLMKLITLTFVVIQTPSVTLPPIWSHLKISAGPGVRKETICSFYLVGNHVFLFPFPPSVLFPSTLSIRLWILSRHSERPLWWRTLIREVNRLKLSYQRLVHACTYTQNKKLRLLSVTAGKTRDRKTACVVYLKMSGVNVTNTDFGIKAFMLWVLTPAAFNWALRLFPAVVNERNVTQLH